MVAGRGGAGECGCGCGAAYSTRRHWPLPVLAALLSLRTQQRVGARPQPRDVLRGVAQRAPVDALEQRRAGRLFDGPQPAEHEAKRGREEPRVDLQ